MPYLAAQKIVTSSQFKPSTTPYKLKENSDEESESLESSDQKVSEDGQAQEIGKQFNELQAIACMIKRNRLMTSQKSQRSSTTANSRRGNTDTLFSEPNSS